MAFNAGQFLRAASVAMLVLAVPWARATGPCAGFNDVDAASPFCPNVEWLKNRQITLGCGAGLYCPSNAVTRLAMAAFLNRLGTALTPVQLFVDSDPGAISLDVGPVLCQTQP